ncbi:MAG: NTP transferase domain-containing protein [Syntrophales bacterium]|jgi:UDP-N-acetylglucosamine diphosphorylase/glucosamine-1-phosphate N-acetyltransferase|nr:NTP transferase domain-containing protein [Syntrophales bacterium]
MIDKKTGFSTIILAAGKGTRMKSDIAKVLHPLGGVPLLSWPIKAAREAGSSRIVVVIGHQAERIRALFQESDLIFVEQRELLGTGHAVLQAREAFQGQSAEVVILCGDVPLIRPSTIRALYEKRRNDRAVVTVLTTVVDKPTGYGRVIKTGDGQVARIVEEKDATAEEKLVREINTGIYCIESPFLFTAVASLGDKNAQREYYLTDIIEIACKNGLLATSLLVSDPAEVAGINTPEDLQRAALVLANLP